MAQLPRCVQQASWKRVWGSVGGAGAGGAGMSIRGVCGLAVVRPVMAPIRALGPRAQSLFIVCRSVSSHRVSRSVVSSCDRLRVDRPGFSRSVSGNFADGNFVSGRGLRKAGLPSLSPFLLRGLSSAEASALADGFLKESLLKEAEEKSGATLAAAEKETENALLTEVEEEAGPAVEVLSTVEKEMEEARERDVLVAEIKSKELELEELRSALRLAQEKHGGGAGSIDSGSVSEVAPGFPEVVDPVEEHAAAEVSAALHGTAHAFANVAKGTTSRLADGSLEAEDGLSEDEGFTVAASEIGEYEELTTRSSAVSEPVAHPWPEWTQFLTQLEEAGHFVNEDRKVADLSGSTNEDVGLIKRACLNFARERDDIFLHYSRKDLEVVARFGCPCTDRKVVNAGKRMRDFLAIDEVSVCKPCALRSSCDRADFKASPDHVSGTPEVIRLLSQYALEVSPNSEGGLRISTAVQKSCVHLLKETMALAAVPRDPNLPKVERKGDTVKSDRRERESKRRIRDSDVEMKPGDWKCEECQYVNFARNRTCRECDAFRPVPEMRPGDWRCPECHFVNFSRNESCHDCKLEKPAGLGNDSFDRGSRYDRGAPQERGSRFGRDSSQDRRSEVRHYDRASERGSYERSGTRDYERGSDRFGSQRGERESFGRSRERGLDSRSGGDDARGGRRSNYEEWKPDLKKRGKFDGDEGKARKSALDILDDDDDDDDDDEEMDDFEFDDSEGDDDGDISDVEAFADEEYEDMRPAVSASRGRGDAGRGREVGSRSVGRNEDKDPWWEDDRTFERSERSERGSRGGRGGGGRGRGGGGGRGGSRGDFGRDSRSSSQDSRPSSYERSDRDSGRSFGRSDRGSDRSFGRSDRDSGRSYGDSRREAGRSSRGRGGGRGGGRGRGRGR